MPFTIEDLVDGVVLPAAAATMITWLWRRWVAGENGRRLGTILPFIAGFHVGYWLLALGPVRPESHWHWLPWVMLLTLFAGLPPLNRSTAILPRLMLAVVIAVASGWLLVPTWEHLEPSRTLHLAVIVVTTALVAALLEPLTVKLPAVGILSVLTVVLLTGAVILALAGSLRFAQMIGCGVAAMSGLTLAAWFDKQRTSAEGIALPFALLVSAMMLIGRVNSFSEVPLLGYLLPPVAPLCLWLAFADSPSRTIGRPRVVAAAMALLVCGAAIGLAVLTD